MACERIYRAAYISGTIENCMSYVQITFVINRLIDLIQLFCVCSFLFSLGLKKFCKSYEESDEEYRMLFPLTDVPGAQPENYLVRFPFYILAERDANIVFSEKQNPDWLVDDVYEICKQFRQQQKKIIK